MSSVSMRLSARTAKGGFVCVGVTTFFLLLSLTGCSKGSRAVLQPVAGVPLHGTAFGGHQPIADSVIQLYAASAGGTGGASTTLISATVTTSDGSGNSSNSNANAGNHFNSLAAGGFTISGDYTCPTADTQVYLAASGGNPGLAPGTNNTAIKLLAALGSCGRLSSSTNIAMDEVTTVGSIAAIYPFMTSYSAVGSVSTATGEMAEAFSTATEYANVDTGNAPGGNLEAGYYGSSTEINTLADVLSQCVNSLGGTSGDGTICGKLFLDAKPGASAAATDVTGAMIDILNNPTQNVTAIFNLTDAYPPYLPVLASAPSNWSLPIVPIPIAPNFSPVAGTYATSQSVSVASPTSGATIYYTTDGTVPTTSSSVYSSAVTVSSSVTLKAMAVNHVSGSVSSASYTIAGAAAAPVFSVGTGSYTAAQTVAMSSTTADAAIYFTTDGTTPTTSSPLYTSSLTINKTETLKAIAVAGISTSATTSATYTITIASQIINTFAGGVTPVGDGGLAAGGRVSGPEGVAVDSNGNLYIADSAHHRIRKVSASNGLITTVAGNGVAGFTGDNGAATSAELNMPFGVVVDSSGNLYVSDTGNQRIRKVTASTGIITTIAGNGTFGFMGDNGAATSAELSNPFGVALDSSGNLYFADAANQRVRKVTASNGMITTVAGDGTQGFMGDGGPATSAELNTPVDVKLDAQGDLYLVDVSNYRIRMVAAGTGTITTVAGSGSSASGGDGGAATSAGFFPYGIAVDPSGNLYISDFVADRVREVSATTGLITTVAGNGNPGSTGDGGAATSARIYDPYGLALDSNGNLYIADSGNQRIREVAASNKFISTVVGNGTTYSLGDGGAATSANVAVPYGVATDASGNVYIADTNNARIRKVAVGTGLITTVAGGGSATVDGGLAINAQINANGVAVDSSGNLYIADASANRIRKVTAATGIITTVAGNGTSGSMGDGAAATSAELAGPDGVAVDASGNIYIADTNNSRVRKVTLSTGFISTVAGNGTLGSAGNGGQATSAEINQPSCVAVDTSGNLYICDVYSIRKVTVSTGVITSAAGNGMGGSFGDGGPATSAELAFPSGVALDTSGNLYIADTRNNRIRKVTGTTINAFAGNYVGAYAGDGGAATSAEIYNPYGVAVDASGNVYIADTNNSRIRIVSH